MKFSAGQIAQFLGGRVEGDPEVSVSTVSKIEEGKVGSLAFLANPKYGKYLYETEASIVLINDDLEITCEVKPTLIRVPNAYESFASLLEMVSQTRPQKVGVDMQAYVSPSAVLGENVYVGT
ncbi:MAG: UDP-3-O-[3-hydroxymyristoyl] glucosamine N-acyltransferase, partial [Bacteroidota bacterium]